MFKVGIKEPGKPIRYVEVDKEYRHQVVEEYIKGWREYVHIGECPNLSFAVDEDGLSKDLETNFYINTNNPKFPIQKIVGVAVFVKTKPIRLGEEVSDLQLDDITPEDMAIIDHLLHPFIQRNLEDNYKGCNGFYFYTF